MHCCQLREDKVVLEDTKNIDEWLLGMQGKKRALDTGHKNDPHHQMQYQEMQQYTDSIVLEVCQYTHNYPFPQCTNHLDKNS